MHIYRRMVTKKIYSHGVYWTLVAEWPELTLRWKYHQVLRQVLHRSKLLETCSLEPYRR